MPRERYESDGELFALDLENVVDLNGYRSERAVDLYHIRNRGYSNSLGLNYLSPDEYERRLVA